MTAREALIQKIVDHGCSGHEYHMTGENYYPHHPDDCPDGNRCANCDCWAHVSERALNELDARIGKYEEGWACYLLENG